LAPVDVALFAPVGTGVSAGMGLALAADGAPVVPADAVPPLAPVEDAGPFAPVEPVNPGTPRLKFGGFDPGSPTPKT
jgi:hypothetical protein